MMKIDEFPLILASASPRRQELLRSAGVPLQVVPSNTDESFSRGEQPEKQVLRLARAKAWEIGKQFPGRWILAADTEVVIDGQVLGKPKDSKEASKMLRLLSGREHRVITGYCLLRSAGRKRKEGHVTTRVFFKPLTSAEIRWYISSREPFDKAGGYAIQGRGAFMVKRIMGSYTNVVGLPLCEVMEALQEVAAVEIFKRILHHRGRREPREKLYFK
ncbi:MAG: septum formation protein Maf [Deltaproteobacteria bacterium]|nr:septum formation protein Maf [Deltaproteobacteria bacterium]